MSKYTGRVAAVLIPRNKRKEEFLVAKRADNGDWEFPGGKQEKDEKILDTAEREIKEEFGIEIESQEARPKYSWESGGYEIVPVLADHEYESLDKKLEASKLEDHTAYEYVLAEKLGANLENAEKKLGKELNALKAYDLL